MIRKSRRTIGTATVRADILLKYITCARGRKFPAGVLFWKKAGCIDGKRARDYTGSNWGKQRRCDFTNYTLKGKKARKNF
mgnify:CR=1 FL=1